MRIKVGYGKPVMLANIIELQAYYDEDKAREIAKKQARKYFEKKHPGRELPDHLRD